MRSTLIAATVLFASLASPASRAGVLTGEETVAGKKLYAAKCAGCHRLYDPSGYDESKWNDWMTKMRRKARLNDEQYAKLSGYLQSLRADASQQLKMK